MSKKINKVGFKCMSGGNPHNRPVLMKDGEVIDQDATVIEDKVIADGMRYIVKMTKGLATGVMSQDEEYIELQNKILKDLIKERSADIRNKIDTESKQKIRSHADAHKCHQKALDKMQALSAKTAQDNSISFLVNDDNQVYRYGSNSPVGMTRNMSGGWRRIDIKELKKDMDAREKAVAERKKKNGPQTTHEKIDDADKEKRIKILANKIIDATTKKKKKVVKKTTKKKVAEKRIPKKRNAKKKIVKAKKRDRK